MAGAAVSACVAGQLMGRVVILVGPEIGADGRVTHFAPPQIVVQVLDPEAPAQSEPQRPSGHVKHYRD